MRERGEIYSERQRLEALRRHRILDTVPESDYDDIVELASQVCGTPMAIITLIDEDRQWFKARKGIDIESTNISVSFCAHTIRQQHLMSVQDATRDERFRNNPLVTGPPHLRFYAGIPITTKDGYRIGSLAVLDTKPRALNETQQKGLRILCHQVVNLISLRVSNVRLHGHVAEKSAEMTDILERINDAFVAVDTKWTITYINEKAAEITNRNPDAVLGKNLWEEFPEAFSSEFPELARKAMETQAHQHIERFFEPYNRWLETNIHASPTGLSIYFRDITERRRAEDSLRKAEEQYRSIFENAIEGIYQSTVDGEFITANPALARMFGYNSPEELMLSVRNIPAQLYVNPGQRLQMRSLLETQEHVTGLELQLMKRDNQVIWVRASIRAIKNGGQIRYFEGRMEDITARKEAEAKLKSHMQELEKTNHELDRFVYSVSHDLRAPLSTILGIINLAEMDRENSALTYFNLIKSNIHRLDGFISDILDYSRNARKEIVVEAIDFKKLLEDVQNNFKALEGAGNIKTDIHVSSSGPFASDRLRLSIIFNNLFSNSIKYQDINKPASRITINIAIDPAKAVIVFSDNGIGIEPGHLGRVFEMFYRASERSKGSGLGLYIARESATKLGGKITVSSQFGEHTTFEIIVPNRVAAVSA